MDRKHVLEWADGDGEDRGLAIRRRGSWSLTGLCLVSVSDGALNSATEIALEGLYL